MRCSAAACRASGGITVPGLALALALALARALALAVAVERRRWCVHTRGAHACERCTHACGVHPCILGSSVQLDMGDHLTEFAVNLTVNLQYM